MPEMMVLPDGREIPRPGWSPGLDAILERERQLRGRFFVVRIGGNAGLGELWRCKRCRGRHDYLTLNCVERPFSGLDQALYAMYQQAGDLAAVRSLGPNQRTQRAGQIGALVPAVPDLARLHPETAARIARERKLDAFDVEIGGLKLGRVEQIPRSLAQRLLDKVNANQPSAARLRVEGLETAA